jgi:hypothetical protein
VAWLQAADVEGPANDSPGGQLKGDILDQLTCYERLMTAAGWLYDPQSVEAFAEREKKRKED